MYVGLVILYSDMENATIFTKSKNYKSWTERDIKRMFRKGFICGYDISSELTYSIISTDNIFMCWLVECDESKDVMDEVAKEIKSKPDKMFG